MTGRPLFTAAPGRAIFDPRRHGLSGDAPFEPPSIPGCFLWLDASDTDSISFNPVDDKVTEWRDKSGNLNHVGQNNNVFQPETGATINGLNAIGRTGTQGLVRSVGDIYLEPDGRFTHFAVTEADTNAPNAIVFDIRDSTTAFPLATMYHGSSNLGSAIARGTDVPLRQLGPTNTAPSVQVAVFSRRDDGSYLWHNGSITDTNSATDDFTTNMDQLWVGSGRDNFGNFEGALGEIIAYNRALSIEEKNSVGNYLAAKWGLTWTDLT